MSSSDYRYDVTEHPEYGGPLEGNINSTTERNEEATALIPNPAPRPVTPVTRCCCFLKDNICLLVVSAIVLLILFCLVGPGYYYTNEYTYSKSVDVVRQPEDVQYYALVVDEINGFGRWAVHVNTAEDKLPQDNIITVFLTKTVKSVPKVTNFNQPLFQGPGITTQYVYDNFNYTVNISDIRGPVGASINVSVSLVNGATLCSKNMTVGTKTSYLLYNCTSNKSGYYQVYYSINESVTGTENVILKYSAIDLQLYNHSALSCRIYGGRRSCSISIPFRDWWSGDYQVVAIVPHDNLVIQVGSGVVPLYVILSVIIVLLFGMFGIEFCILLKRGYRIYKS